MLGYNYTPLIEVQALGAMSEALKYLEKTNNSDKDDQVKSLQTRISEMEHFGQVSTYSIFKHQLLNSTTIASLQSPCLCLIGSNLTSLLNSTNGFITQ